MLWFLPKTRSVGTMAYIRPFFAKTNKLNKYSHEYTASSGEDEKRGGRIEENVGVLKMFSFSGH